MQNVDKCSLSATMLREIHVALCSQASSAVLENAAGFLRLRDICMGSNKTAALEYVYTLGKLILHSPKCCTCWNAIGADFLEVQIPPCVLIYDWDPYVSYFKH